MSSLADTTLTNLVTYSCVATGGNVLRVFDLTHIWAMNASTAEVGLGTDGNFHARYHTYALPQIGAYWYEGGAGCVGGSGATPCFSSLTLDRSGIDSFVAVEHMTKGGGRIVRWPLDYTIALPKRDTDGYVRAVEAFASGTTSVWTKAPRNSENLCYWPATGELWLISEQLRERVTVHIPWPV